MNIRTGMERPPTGARELYFNITLRGASAVEDMTMQALGAVAEETPADAESY